VCFIDGPQKFKAVPSNIARDLERELTVARGLEQMAMEQRNKAWDELKASRSAKADKSDVEMAKALLRSHHESQYGHLITAGNYFVQVERAREIVATDSGCQTP